MTIIKDGKVMPYIEPPDKCELCGKIAELRPYGPNGEKICFACGMKDEKTTKEQFKKLIQLSEIADSN